MRLSPFLGLVLRAALLLVSRLILRLVLGPGHQSVASNGNGKVCQETTPVSAVE